MAGGSLLALFDDIVSILDDVSTMSKVALEKTAGVVGDDLALNAKQIMGVRVNRELPIVWAVAKGSLVNKAILVPAALLISYATPWLVMPLLMLGGLYLCYEGVEKLWHKWFHSKEHGKEHDPHAESATHATLDSAAAFDNKKAEQDEKIKIRGAIRTDFILSAEIIVIALGTVADVSLGMRALVLSAIAILMTVGVYGLVAAILKIDDLGIWMQTRTGESSSVKTQHKLGRFLVVLAPYLMRFLAVAGTAAMFLVGGGIVVHNTPPIHHWLEHALEPVEHWQYIGCVAHWFAEALFNLVVGVGAGLIIVLVEKVVRKYWTARTSQEGQA
jgi:predicted DNA repair protein MutK